MNNAQLKKEYESFFRNGGYRIMRLMVIKAELEPHADENGLDVIRLMRLQHCEAAEKDYLRERANKEICRISDIYDLDAALSELMAMLPRNWGKVLDMYFGRGAKKKAIGSGVRKRTIENALDGMLDRIEQSCSEGKIYMGCYDYASEGLPAVREIMTLISEASEIGDDISNSLLMRAVTSMKLFREGEHGLKYDETLEEFREKTKRDYYSYIGTGGTDMIISDIFVREEVGDMQQASRLEDKVREGRSSVLINRMYEMYGIMAAIKEYMPDKYEKIMSFHWTHNNEKLTSLFMEMAAMINACEKYEREYLQ